jgi:hypothetical protein
VEAFKIAITCIAAAILYGIIHDQFTARICVEYFTIFHPPIFPTQSPTWLGIGWGIIATWWVGAFFSIPMILAARAGSHPVMRASEIRRPIGFLLVFMAVCAVVFGVLGYLLARKEVINTDWLSFSDSPTVRARFMADWWAHSASYAGAFVGGTIVCIVTYRKRTRKQTVPPDPEVKFVAER